MKKVYIFLTAICLAVLTGCIKEEAHIREDIQFDVTLTRAGNTSEQQGDQIEDVMIWAFDINNDMNCVGWRTYTPPTTTYTSLSLHIPAKTCGDNGGKYRLVAILNTSEFTDAYGSQIVLNRNTTYDELISGKFVSSNVINSAIEENNPGNPAVMPVSHWMDVEVVKSNTHENTNTDADWQHLSVNMPVYRTVAKTQFFMAKKGDSGFKLNVTSLNLHSKAMPTDGMILSSVANDGLSAKDANPAWTWESTSYNPTESTTAGVYTLVDAEPIEVKKSLDEHVTSDNGNSEYDLIGSHFIYETTKTCTYTDNSDSAPEGDGYYYEVKYTVDGEEYTRYVGIPNQIARNHDYQVRALVEKSGANLSLVITINPWNYREVTYPNTPLIPTE